jgi:hypothetical protein
MRVSVRFPSRAADAGHQAPSAGGSLPTPREVLGEIGLALAIHLAVAFGIAVLLGSLGIA